MDMLRKIAKMKVKVSAKRIFAFVILITLFTFAMYAGTNSKQIASALKSTFEQETIVENEQETVQNPITIYDEGFSKAVETINSRSAETSDRKTSVIFLTDGEP